MKTSKRSLPLRGAGVGEIFDDAFQAELEGMYRTTGAGEEPVPPALMAMVMLLQG